MKRGVLRVYLGSAPGVGKTYRMLDEGWRRRQRGTDVVIGYVETHDRPLTQAQQRDLEVVPRITRDYRGARFEEMDLAAVLLRNPQVALVDEFAHTNAPGGLHEKRWQDVEDLLAAGIDVITTVNIQHLESVNDVVEKITGITQQETIPDAVVRRSEQIELVDITPEALRRRMAHGNIYVADKIDTSLSNYFRVGNLSALRELALLWLADRVEDALQRYLDDHEISEAWETRERLIVGVTGTPVDEALLHRAARIASRTGAKLVAVHVVSADGVRPSGTDTSTARALVDEFDGTFQEIVDDNIATALVAVARSERGTQIVLGASRERSVFRRRSGVVENVLRHARDLDVHIIAVGGERPARVRQRRQKKQFTRGRQALGLGIAAVVLPLLTVLMTSARSNISLSTVFLAYLVVVLALTTWSGAFVGITVALMASGLENYYFVRPLHTLQVARPDDVVALVAFVLFASGASVLVSEIRRGTIEADWARAEAEILTNAAATAAITNEDLLPLLDSLRAVFAATSVATLVRRADHWTLDLVSGEPVEDIGLGARFVIDVDHALLLQGASLDTQDRQLVGAFAARIAAALRSQSIAQDAAQLRAIAEMEALRTDLLRVVSHDLRNPLADIEMKVSSLLHDEAKWSTDKQRQDLVSIEREAQRLTRLVESLNEVGRLEAGVVVPRSTSVTVAQLLADALTTIDKGGRTLDIDLPDDLPMPFTDPDLAERVIANVVGNACRFSPIDRSVRITSGVAGDYVELLVIDRGPGIPLALRTTIFTPFHRIDDEQSGVGLGLSVASGLIQLLGGHLRLEDTPGGGLTVAIEFPRTPADEIPKEGAGPSSTATEGGAPDNVTGEKEANHG